MTYEKKVLTYKGKVVFEKISMPKFKRIPKLYDESEACFMFINNGEYTVRTQDLLVQFDSQNALLAKCFNYFFELDREQWERTAEIQVVGVIFYPSIIEEIFNLDLTELQQKGIDGGIKKVKVDQLLQNFKENISYLLDHPNIADDNLVLLKLREFVQLILRQETTHSVATFFSGLFNPVEYDLKTTVEHNLYSNLTIGEFAQLCNMSISTFKRKFKSLYKETFRNYILQKKIIKAKNLLQYSTLSITQIAYEVGFESISTFNRNFKKQTELSPSDYKIMSKDS